MQQTLLIDVLDHWHQQAVRRIDGEADMHVFLADDRFAARGQRTVEVRQFLEQMRASLEQQRQHGQLDAGLLRHGLLRDAECFQVGDIGRIELGHVWHVEPAAVQVGGADLHQAGHRHFFDFAELAEVHGRDRRDAGATGGSSGSRLRCGLGLVHHGLDVSLHVFLENAAFRAGAGDIRQLHSELTRQLTHGRAGVHLGAAALGCIGRVGSCSRQRGDGAYFCGHFRCGAFRYAVHFLAGLRRRSGRCSARDLELENQVAGADLVIQLDQHFFHHAGSRRGDFHGGLVGLQGQQALVGFDAVAGLDHDLDDLALGAGADVRHAHVLHAAAARCGGRCRGCGGCGSLRRRGRRSRGRRSSSFDFQLEDQVASADFIIQLDQHLLHHAGSRRGDFHGGLVGLQGDQRLVGFDGVAGLDHDFDDLDLAVGADIRHVHVLHAAAGGSSGGRGCRSGRFRGFGRRSFGFRRRRGLRGTFDFQHQQFVAFLQAIADLDLQFLDHAGFGRGHFHGGLVGLQGQYALIGFDTVADLDQQFNHLAFTAEVGYANQLTHRYAP